MRKSGAYFATYLCFLGYPNFRSRDECTFLLKKRWLYILFTSCILLLFLNILKYVWHNTWSLTAFFLFFTSALLFLGANNVTLLDKPLFTPTYWISLHKIWSFVVEKRCIPFSLTFLLLLFMFSFFSANKGEVRKCDKGRGWRLHIIVVVQNQ